MKKIDIRKFDPLIDPDKRILFVFGAARSGTTYLGKIIENYFDYGMGPEGAFLGKYANCIDKYGDLESKENMGRLLSDVHDGEMLTIMRKRWREEIRTDVTMDMLWENLHENSFASVVYSVFASVAEGQGKPLVGNKDPGYLRHLDLLDRLFPVQACYLDIVRDGRDVALSNLRMKWGQSNILSCAKTWEKSLACSEEFSKKVRPGAYLQIKYEKLLDEPLETLAEIEKFLKIELTAEQISHFMSTHESNNLKGNHGKWRDRMTIDDQRIYEAVAGAALRRHEYETLIEKPSVSMLEVSRAQLTELWRKIKLNLG